MTDQECPAADIPDNKRLDSTICICCVSVCLKIGKGDFSSGIFTGCANSTAERRKRRSEIHRCNGNRLNHLGRARCVIGHNEGDIAISRAGVRTVVAENDGTGNLLHQRIGGICIEAEAPRIAVMNRFSIRCADLDISGHQAVAGNIKPDSAATGVDRSEAQAVSRFCICGDLHFQGTTVPGCISVRIKDNDIAAHLNRRVLYKRGDRRM